MRAMSICRADVEALKAPEWLSVYLRSRESERRAQGGKFYFTCHLHVHKHPDKPHLRVEERGGEGVAVCDSYGVIGDIFATAQAYGDGGISFPDTVRAVADAVGYTLREDDYPRRGRRRQTRREMPHVRPQEPAERADVERVSYLSPDEEKAALEAVRRLACNDDALARYADELGLPAGVLRFHADAENCGGNGLLGLSREGKLLYLYTAYDDEGRLRVRYVKTRNKPMSPPYYTTPKQGVKVELWGVDALRREDCRRVIITEGESDCLAVRAAVWAWLDDWSHNSPDDFPPAESWPLVLACPGAGLFSAEWLGSDVRRKLLAADVILVHDNDDAGRTGAEKTAGRLQADGARRVFVWCPLAGVKDAREALDPAHPWLLAEDIMTNKRQF